MVNDPRDRDVHYIIGGINKDRAMVKTCTKAIYRTDKGNQYA